MMRLWKHVLAASCAVLLHVPPSAEERRTWSMDVIIVEEAEACPPDGYGIRAAVSGSLQRSCSDILDELEGFKKRNNYQTFELSYTDRTVDLELTDDMKHAIEAGISGHAAVFIFYLDRAFESIRFIREEDGWTDEANGHVPSLARWYHHWRATSVAPTNQVLWRVHLDDELAITFKFVTPSEPTGGDQRRESN